MEESSEQTAPKESLSQALANEIIRLTKHQTGRGPVKCRAYLHDDCLLMLMRQGHTTSEDSMAKFGQQRGVAQTRVDMAEGGRQAFIDAVERLTGRKVESFVTSSHQDPSIFTHVYVFAF